ncbi:MAG: dihydrolipoyl dehydrogenase [Gammaproteobacteria bacterium]|nr:MAG: dihydrolipoyl dehydrogenase [Gammaproteobacteria bacterium]
MNKGKLIIIAVIAALIVSFFVFDLGQYFTLDYIKSQRELIDGYYQDNPFKVAGIFFAIYVAVAALSLPGAAILTLVGGAIFGFLSGLVLVSFASSIGATVAFLVSRFVLRDSVQKKFGNNLASLNAGIEKEGGFYLFTIRLIPAFPFFIVNLLMGLTPIKTWTFYWVSQLGMLAGTAVFINAGTQLATIESIGDILSPGLILSFVLLGVFPLIAKKIIDTAKANKILKNYPKPKKFDTNMVVIGGGSAGLVTSYIAAAVKAKVTLIERHKMGGDCLNTGCVPSKAILRSGKILSYMKRAKEFGFKSASADFEFKDVMERVQKVVQTIEPHDSIERYSSLGVDCITGDARVTSPYTVEVNGKTITTPNIIIATGARPFVPPIEGIDKVNYLTSDNVWDLRDLPKRLIVLGGGPIGCELAQAFARHGSEVTQIEMMSRIMIREDEEVSEIVAKKFAHEGINVLTDHRAVRVKVNGDEKQLVCLHNEAEVVVPFDEILVAVGRAANVKGFGLEEIGVNITPRGTIEVDDYLRSNVPTIFACGDVAGPYQFTHTAAHQAWYAAVNSLFGKFKKFKVDYSVIPWATFTDPEVARVGLNELEAKEKGIEYEVTQYDIDDLDRAIADQEAHGFIKVLTVPGKDKILGVTIVGHHAGDLIAEYVMAMKHKIGLNKILGTIHIYPTLAESNKYVAGNWKRAHSPKKLLEWVKKFHNWRIS